MPEEVNSRTVLQSYLSCVSPFSNHLADTAHAGRGGSLWVRFNDNQIIDLLAVADWSAIPGGKPAANTVAVRNPSVSFVADKAIFSMVVGAPSGPSDTTVFFWQLYEITLPTQAQLNANVKPVLTRVANQPLYNNILPIYAPGGRIVFASDRPYNGQAHLLQREEYLGLPTVSGLWSLDPATGNLLLLHHSPSGSFSPMVDSFGRLIFINWDHLSRDSEAVTDSRNGNPNAPYNETFTQTFNGAGNFVDETAAAPFTQVTAMAPNSWDIFPEPRNFDRVSLIDVYLDTINGNSQNIFLPWAINLDGTNGEILNHVGRHEVGAGFPRSFKNDTNVVDFNPTINPGYGGLTPHNFFFNLLSIHEDPLSPGTYLGTDGQDLGTHGAGQIVRLNNAGSLPDGTPRNPDNITVTYITAGATNTKPATIPTVRPSINLPPTGQSPLANPETLYRTPLPLADGNLIASQAANVNQTDYNSGTLVQPASLYTFRLRSLKLSGSTYVSDTLLTTGININTTYYDGATQVSYNGPAWELDPAEVVARTPPVLLTAGVDPIEANVFSAAGVHIPTFQNYLRGINAALSVSRDVTKRDQHDRQQPFNLKVFWSNTQTLGAGTSGKIYNVAWLQFLQGDLRRGYLLGGSSAAPGRRVVATPMHDTMTENVQTPGAPPGSVRLGDDGSFAAIVPAGKALTWHLLDNDAAKTSQVKERFWVTFQRGEIRTCANCHGINSADQAGASGRPTNPPQALMSLLQQWKTRYPAGAVAHTAAAVSVPKNGGTVTLDVARTGGTTGPASVDYATANGTALAGVDYTATSGTLNWADGDSADKTITIPVLNNPVVGADKTLSVTLANPQFASLGAQAQATVTITETATAADGGTPDANVTTDAGATPDSGTGTPDAGIPDSGTGTPDVGTSDSSTGTPDASVAPDASVPPGGGAGCACRTGTAETSSPVETLAAVGLLLGLAVRLRRRKQ